MLLVIVSCLGVCDWGEWVRGRLLHWAEITHPVKHDISFTLWLVSSSQTLWPWWKWMGIDKQRHILYVQITEVQAKGPHYLLCCDCAHSSNSSLALWTFRIGGIWTLIPTGESHYGPHTSLWMKPTSSLILALNFGEFLDKIMIYLFYQTGATIARADALEHSSKSTHR